MITDAEAGGLHWRLDTDRGPIHVWRPATYSGRAVVLYVHGYNTNVDQAWRQHHLADQFKASGLGAIYIAPEAPVGSSEGVRWPQLGALLAEVSRQTGLVLAPPYHVVGHSGAYRTIAHWLSTPGLQQITLLDALYGHVADFVAWASGPERKLITVAIAGAPLDNSRKIANKPGVVFQQVKATHMGLVTSGAFLPGYLRSMGGGTLIAGVAIAFALGIGYLLWR